MIGSLAGTLAARPAEAEVLVEVGGVGYRVSVSTPTAAALGPMGSEVRLFVHTHVREDAIVLYGFAHDDERRCFEVLLGAHGVGPALALAILSQLSPAALTTALLEEDVNALCAVPGVGRKTAARLLIDLKSRLDLPDLSIGGPSGATSGSGVARAEVRAALADLGYGPDEIRGALERIAEDEDEDSVEALLRGALRELASR
jgi:holliday junction DNA helicase RuvA